MHDRYMIVLKWNSTSYMVLGCVSCLEVCLMFQLSWNMSHHLEEDGEELKKSLNRLYIVKSTFNT